MDVKIKEGLLILYSKIQITQTWMLVTDSGDRIHFGDKFEIMVTDYPLSRKNSTRYRNQKYHQHRTSISNMQQFSVKVSLKILREIKIPRMNLA